MGNEDICHSHGFLQLAQQIQYLRLDGNIQCRYRLIADYQRRVKHDRAGNTDSLTLSAGELVRIAVVVFGVQSYDLRVLLWHTA